MVRKKIVVTEKDSNVWRWVSGILASVLLTGLTAYWVFGLSANNAIASLKTDLANVKDLQATSVMTLQKVGDVLVQIQIQNTDINTRVKALEHRNDLSDARK